MSGTDKHAPGASSGSTATARPASRRCAPPSSIRLVFECAGRHTAEIARARPATYPTECPPVSAPGPTRPCGLESSDRHHRLHRQHWASSVGRRASSIGRRASSVGRRASGVGRRASSVGHLSVEPVESSGSTVVPNDETDGIPSSHSSHSSLLASADISTSAISRALDPRSARTSRSSPLVPASTHRAARKLPKSAPAGRSETASEDLSSGAGRASMASLHTSWTSPHSSLTRIVNSRPRPPSTTSRTSTTSSPLHALSSSSTLSKLSTAGAASRGVLQSPPPSGVRR